MRQTRGRRARGRKSPEPSGPERRIHEKFMNSREKTSRSPRDEKKAFLIVWISEVPIAILEGMLRFADSALEQKLRGLQTVESGAPRGAVRVQGPGKPPRIVPESKRALPLDSIFIT